MLRESHNSQVFQFFFRSCQWPMASELASFSPIAFRISCLPRSQPKKNQIHLPSSFALNLCLFFFYHSWSFVFGVFGYKFLAIHGVSRLFSNLRIFFQRRSKTCCAICVLTIKKAEHVRCQFGHQSNG